MAINIVDQFQVNTYLPIDNRFVVGSASMSTLSGTYSPFYLYKDDILYKYPGLRVWDFNDGVPYVWTGSTWSNENTTGALVQNGGGHQNWVPKFLNNSTLLGKSLMFDNGANIGLGISTAPSFPTGATGGIHVQGWIKTNTGFVGIGTNLTALNASNITLGSLNIERIASPNPFSPGINYVLTSVNGSNSWQDINSISPVINGTNLSGGAGIFSQLNTGTNQYEFRSLTSTGFDITQSTNNINLETKPGVNLGSSTIGKEVYKGLNSTSKLHEFYKIKSDTLKVENDGTYLTIESPSTSTIPSLYVNANYIPTYDEWFRYKTNNELFTLGHIGANQYAGDGSIARPFTNTIEYTSPNTYTITSDTAISNVIRSYLGTGTRILPQKIYNQIYVQSGVYNYFGEFNYNRLNIVLDNAALISNPTSTNWLIDLDDTTYFGLNDSVTITINLQGYSEIRLEKSGFRNSGTKVNNALYTSSKIIYIFGNDNQKCSIVSTEQTSLALDQKIIIESNWNSGNPVGYNIGTGAFSWTFGLDVNGYPITGNTSTSSSDTYTNDSNATFQVNNIQIRTKNQTIMRLGGLISDFNNVVFSISEIGYTTYLNTSLIAFQFAGASYTRTRNCQFYWFGGSIIKKGINLKHKSTLTLNEPLLNGTLSENLVYGEITSASIKPFIRIVNSTTLDGINIGTWTPSVVGDIFGTNTISFGKWDSIYMNNCYISRGNINEERINLRGLYNIQSSINSIGDSTGFIKQVLYGSLEKNTYHNRGTLFILKGLNIADNGTTDTQNAVGNTGTLSLNYAGDVIDLLWGPVVSNTTIVKVRLKNAMNSLSGTGTISSSTGTNTITGVGTAFTTQLQVGDVIYRTSPWGRIGTVAKVNSNTSITLTNNSLITASSFSFTVIKAYLVKFYIESLSGITTASPDNTTALMPVYEIIDSEYFYLRIRENTGAVQNIKIHFEAIQL